MRSTLLMTVAAVLTLGPAAHAQSIGRMLLDDFKNAGKDMVSIWGSPFDASRRDWLLAAGAAGAFGVATFADQSVSNWANDNDSSAFFRALKPVRRGGFLFTGKNVVPPVAAVYVLGVALKNQDMRDFVMGCMSAWGAQSVIRKSVYRLVERSRPDSTPDDPHQWGFPGGTNWQLHSFPAGHFANAMSCATYWNTRFKLGPAGAAVYGLAAAVGIGRIADKGHWTSDTVLGGILGYAVGREIANRALQRQSDRVTRGAQLYLSPDQTAVTLGMRWSF
jgi:membrane-associated phospholipid phosphatase